MAIDRDKFLIDDEKWSHPELKEWLLALRTPETNPNVPLFDPDVPLEKKRELAAAIDWAAFSQPLDESKATMKEYEIPGCPEEPDAPLVKTQVYTPIKPREKMPAILYCLSGGMIAIAPRLDPPENYVAAHNCVVIVPNYRISLEAPYPAALNDMHAAYAWAVEHADELSIDPDCIVLYGQSTGGHLATTLPFRLKRYGFRPRGVVALTPVTDDREYLPSSRIDGVMWGEPQLRSCYELWMTPRWYGNVMTGPEAFANHATVEDCIGYPPLYIHSGEFDPSSDYDREFAGKVKAARSYVEFHAWGGVAHHQVGMRPKVLELVSADIDECIAYDLRRPWVEEE
jgi:acetyl esterase/lipase